MSTDQIYVQDESKNPYGTWKDRRSKYIVQQALKEGVSKLCLISSGNAAYSLAKFAEPYNIKVVCVVDKNLSQEIKNKLSENSYSVIETDLNNKFLNPEDVIKLARENTEETIWEVTNGFSEAYVSIVDELKDKSPDYVICPVGSGEAFVGLHQGILENKLGTKLVGIGVKEHPSFADKLSHPVRHMPVRFSR